MAIYCDKCKQNINTFWGAHMYLSDNHYLCKDCARPIANMIGSLPYQSTKEKFDELSKKIIDTTRDNYDESLVDIIQKKVNKIENESFSKNSASSETIDNRPQLPSDSTIINDSAVENIGKKLISAGNIITWIGVISSIIAGIFYYMTTPIVGIILIVVGLSSSWISGLVLKGFGQLVKNSDEITELLRQKK